MKASDAAMSDNSLPTTGETSSGTGLVLVLPAGVWRQIETEGEAAYPNECCGILVGRDEPGGRRLVERLVPMRNEFDPAERYHRFTIDPRDMERASNEADAAGQAILGFYHSHPDHPARPSEYDRQHVPPWGFYSHVIVAIEKGAAAAMTCWQMDEQTEQFMPQQILRLADENLHVPPGGARPGES